MNEERPMTEPKWALIRVPWKDEKHALDPITAQIMFDYAAVKGLDPRRCVMRGVPTEAWGDVPNAFMIIYQLGTDQDLEGRSPAEPSPEEVVSKYKAGDYLTTPIPGEPAYELYNHIYQAHRKALQEIASLLLQVQQKLLTMGVG